MKNHLRNFIRYFKKHLNIELSSTIFMTLFSSLIIILIFSNQSLWGAINGALRGILGAQIDYILILLIIFGSIAVYGLGLFILGFWKRKYLHKRINLIFPPTIVVLFVVALIGASFVDERVSFDIIWYSMGDFYLLVYSIAIFLTIFLILLLQIKLRDLSQSRNEELSPKLAVISTAVSNIGGLSVILLLLTVYPDTYVFWDAMRLLLFRYLIKFYYLLLLIVIPFAIWISILILKVKKSNRIEITKKKRVLFYINIVLPIIGLIILILVSYFEFSSYYELFSVYIILLFTILISIPYILLIFFTYRIFNLQISIKSRLNFLKMKNRRKPEGKNANRSSKLHLFRFMVCFSFTIVFFIPLVIMAPNMDLPFQISVQNINDVNVPFRDDMVIPNFEMQPNISDSGSRLYVDLNTDDWKFKKSSEDADLTFQYRTDTVLAEFSKNQYNLREFDDSEWKKTSIPSCFNTPDGTPDGSEYQGVCWYRKEFKLPDLDPLGDNPSIILKCLGANYIVDVWVDENYVGYHEGGFNSFAFDITDYISSEDDNHLLSIRVDSVGIYSDYNNKIVPPTGDFFNYGGIYRDIYLEICPNAHIVRADVRTMELETNDHLSGSVDVEIDVTIQNKVDAVEKDYQISLAIHRLEFHNSTEIMDKQTWNYINATGHPTIVGDMSRTIKPDNDLLIDGEPTPYFAEQFSFTLKDIDFWSTKIPNLYLLEVNMTHEGRTDRFFTQTGFREFKTNEKQILLNGKPLFLAGNSYHEEYPGVGRSLSDERRYKDLELIKDNLSSNFLRSHYPLHPYTYILTDRMGLACWEENPVYWFNDIKFMYGEIRNSVYAMLIEMIYRDYNRPSILFWGAANEPFAQSKLEPYLINAREIQEEIDPTRILAYASHSSHLSLTQTSHDLMEIASPNTYWGTFEGEFGEFYEGTKYAIGIHAENYPNKPILSMEYGVWRSAGEDVQVDCFFETTEALMECDNVVGFTHWIAFDYYGNDYHNSMGVFNIERTWAAPVADVMSENYQNFTKNNL